LIFFNFPFLPPFQASNPDYLLFSKRAKLNHSSLYFKVFFETFLFDPVTIIHNYLFIYSPFQSGRILSIASRLCKSFFI